MVENVWRIRGVQGKFWCARTAVTKVAFFRCSGHGVVKDPIYIGTGTATHPGGWVGTRPMAVLLK